MSQVTAGKNPTQGGGNTEYKHSATVVQLAKSGPDAEPAKIWTYGLLDLIAIEIARQYANEYGEPFFVAVGDFSPFDIYSRSNTVRLEVKVETTPMRTGNVCIEYWSTDYKRPSGILSTEATLWLHVVPKGESLLGIEYEVGTLRKMVMENGQLQANHNSLFKLMPLELFLKHSRRTFDFQSRFYEELMVTTGAKRKKAQSLLTNNPNQNPSTGVSQ